MKNVTFDIDHVVTSGHMFYRSRYDCIYIMIRLIVNEFNSVTVYWSDCTKPGQWLVTNTWVRGINFSSVCIFQGGWIHVIIGSHCVPLEGRFLLIALDIVRIITLYVIVRQMPLSSGSIVQNLIVKLSNTSTMLLPPVAKRYRNVESLTTSFWTMATPLFSGHYFYLLR